MVCVSDGHFLMFSPCEDGSHPGPRTFIHEREKVKKDWPQPPEGLVHKCPLATYGLDVFDRQRCSVQKEQKQHFLPSRQRFDVFLFY